MLLLLKSKNLIFVLFYVSPPEMKIINNFRFHIRN